MSVQDTVSRVAEVLGRAESLFASPGQPTRVSADAAAQAAEASDAIAARTGDLTGAIADAHHDLLAALADRLHHSADTDTQLVDQLSRAAEIHAASTERAGEVTDGIADVSAALGDWTELPVGELAALLAMRHAVADMQRLLGDQAAESSRIAEGIVNLGYPP